MQATAGIDALRWKTNAGSWTDAGACETLLGLLESSGFEMSFTHIAKLSGKPRRLTSRKQLVDQLAAEDVHLTADGVSDRSLSFIRDADRESIAARLSGDNWGACSIRFVKALHLQLKDRLLIGPKIFVTPEIAASKLRPPRRHQFLVMQSCCDVLSAEGVLQSPFVIRHPNSREEFEKQFQTLATEKLPEGARRTLDDDLLTLQWAPDDAREEQVRGAIEMRQRWLNEHITLELEGGYNALGDAAVYGFGLTEHANATFYNEGAAEAYKAVVAFKGKIDASVLDDVRIWLKKGALPDGKPLKRANLILPNRQAALDVRDVALSAGVSKVLYVDDSGGWWDPFPEGDWIE
jgi:hypothetical protein